MNIFERLIAEPFERFFERTVEFLPLFFSALLIFVLGLVVGLLLKWIFARFFRAVGIDRLSERSGTVELLKKGGMQDSVSGILAKMIGWITIIMFTVISMRTLEIPAVENLLESLLLYLPNVFVAILIILTGYFLANFFGRTALIASVNAGLKLSGLVGRLVKLSIYLLAVTMALEQLGIGRGTIVIAFAIIFGGVVLALSLAFGLGGRDIAKEYLEQKLKGEEEKKDEFNHL
ncbi:MAG: hypothetical protein A2X59_01075 [Nitrospirae bacterium GWC2_42_7]|nr:MAG: hypothetical protein A2X59_01075 [Nitrospirae bacterium GWC2_42_7]